MNNYLTALVKNILNFHWILSNRYEIGKKLLYFFRNKYDQSIKKELIGFNNKNKDIYEKYTAFYDIPDEGLQYDKCMALIKEYYNATLEMTKTKHFSGTIYQDTMNVQVKDLDLPHTLETLYLEIYQRSHMWNALHDHEFHVVNLINLQLISCCANLFGGDLKNTQGLVTTGGTQSIMSSARMYMNWGINEKGLARNKCTIIALDTIHASLMKAQQAYGFKLILVPTKNGNVDYNELITIVRKHCKNLVALYCSLPSYAYGTQDDVEFFAKLAVEYQVGLHIDCCLGGFIVNFVTTIASKLLQLNGVTSISIDTHKNGLAPKGSSVLLTRKLGKYNLLYHSIYAFSDWNGGLYGTVYDPGSSSCVESFCALITLLYYGKNSYRDLASRIHYTTKILCNSLEQNKYISVINKDPVNVFAIKLKLKHGATYRLSDLMAERGFIFNTMTNDIIHFCITKRFISNEDTVSRFLDQIDKCISIILDELSKNPNIEYSGNAKLYCTVDEIRFAMDNSSFSKYFENYFFGKLGVEDTIRMHFLSINNPFVE